MRKIRGDKEIRNIIEGTFADDIDFVKERKNIRKKRVKTYRYYERTLTRIKKKTVTVKVPVVEEKIVEVPTVIFDKPEIIVKANEHENLRPDETEETLLKELASRINTCYSFKVVWLNQGGIRTTFLATLDISGEYIILTRNNKREHPDLKPFYVIHREKFKVMLRDKIIGYYKGRVSWA